ICFYLQGWAELDEVQAQAREIKNHRIENHRLSARVSTPLITPLDAAHQSSPRTAPHLDDPHAIHPPLASCANHRWPRLHYNSTAEQACIFCIIAWTTVWAELLAAKALVAKCGPRRFFGLCTHDAITLMPPVVR